VCVLSTDTTTSLACIAREPWRQHFVFHGYIVDDNIVAVVVVVSAASIATALMAAIDSCFQWTTLFVVSLIKLSAKRGTFTTSVPLFTANVL